LGRLRVHGYGYSFQAGWMLATLNLCQSSSIPAMTVEAGSSSW
jgi:hypothetical protein